MTIRAIHSFLQASADLTAAGAASPNPPLSSSYGIPIPSFVRVSYLSNESRKASKYRLHGDYFHPAAWEICKDSYETAWIKNSLSGSGGANGLCYNNNGGNGQQEKKRSRRLDRPSDDCGQWWIQMTESQVPTEPEVYANQRTPPVVKGGSNFFWIVTELQRREIVKRHICLHENKKDKTANVRCPLMPHAVIPLGDMESFMINFTPNTALGWAHDDSFRPGYTREKERELELEKVESRETITSAIIEEALYDYTVYPVALMRKEATLKAVRSQDAVLSKQPQEKEGSLFALPRMVKSSYYDITFTKPRPPILGWCQAIARKGLCTLYSDYFRAFKDLRCVEACGMKRDWTLIDEEGQ